MNNYFKLDFNLKFLSLISLICLCCWQILASEVRANQLQDLELAVNNKVARGDAFLATVTSKAPLKQVTFQWGKKYTVNAVENNGLYQASMLLGVAIDTKEQNRTLNISANKQHKSQKIDFYDRERPVQKLTVERKYVAPPKEQLERIEKDKQKVRKALSHYSQNSSWQVPFVRPVEGDVSSLFGLKRVFNDQPRGFHKGLDLRGPTGTPVKACANGKVVLADSLYFAGNSVYLHHGHGVFTAYLHLSKINVKMGQEIQAGQVIGLVGATGRVTGPHLHLSLFTQGSSVDILPFLADQAKVKQSAAKSQ